MGFLVGNDFIPNLPNLHIANGSLPVLYQTYMKVLPTFDGEYNNFTANILILQEIIQETLSIFNSYYN